MSEMKGNANEEIKGLEFYESELVDEFIQGIDLEWRFDEAREQVLRYKNQFIIEGESPRDPVDDLIRRMISAMLLGLADAQNYIRNGIKALEPKLTQAAKDLARSEVLSEKGMASNWQYGSYEEYFKDLDCEVLKVIDEAFALVPDAQAFDELVSEVNKVWPDDEVDGYWWTLEVEKNAAWPFFCNLVEDLKGSLEQFGVPNGWAAVADVCHNAAVLCL